MPEDFRIPLTSEAPNAGRVAALQSLFPEAFAEGKLDFEKLRAALGGAVSAERERYGLSWAGKSEAVHGLQALSVGTLQPAREESVRFDATGNAIIEGDNLEVLKLLQKPYNGKIKMIYIDPPYNTGNEFIYPDNFREGLQDYLRYSGQVSESGLAATSNKETDGRYHSKWLSMMYPRLFLAKNLLREDGVIFVSIDDNEVANLRLLMDEIFGEENLLGTFVWQSKKGGGSDNKATVTDQEYILCFGKGQVGISKITLEAEELDKLDEKGPYRRGRELNKWGANSRREDRPTMYFPIPGPNSVEVFPVRNDSSEGCWRWGKPKMLAAAQNQDIEFVLREDKNYVAYEKVRTKESRLKPYRTWLSNVGSTADGSKVVRDLFDSSKVFDFAKPLSLLQHLISIGTIDDDDIILDFFAGSGTTAQAVLELNKEDGGDRKFILVQLPEKTANPQYPTIADITRERVRRVIGRMDGTDAGKLALGDEGIAPDRGFKAFRLGASNFKIWDGSEGGEDKDEVSRQLALFADNVLPDAPSEGILFEILIKGGYELSAAREEIVVAGHPVTRVNGGSLLVCLERPVTRELLDGLIALEPRQVVCLDEAFHGDDALLTNIVLQMRNAGVEFRTI